MPTCHDLEQTIRRSAGPARRAAINRMVDLPAEQQCSAFRSLVGMLSDGTLQRSEVAHLSPLGVRMWSDICNRLASFQLPGTSIELRCDPYYQEVRGPAEWLLDLLRYFPGPEVDQALKDATSLADPLLAYIAADALLTRGLDVGQDALLAVANDIETRCRMWGRFGAARCRELVPGYLWSPEAIAASCLAWWLALPSELDAIPEDVEFVGSYQGDPEKVYLFRFREYPKPWEEGEGWMAAIAWSRDGERSDFTAWSEFDAWADLTPDQHFQRLWRCFSCCDL